MSETLQWRGIRLTNNQLNQALQWGDSDSNGSLLDAADRLPRVELGPRDGLLLINAGLAAHYRSHFTSHAPAVSRTFRAAVSTNRSLIARDVLQQDPSKTNITPQDLIEIMRRNGGHPVRLGDLAWLYPNARIRGEGERLQTLQARRLFSASHPQGITLADALLDPGGELIVSHFYATELRNAAPSFTQFMTNRRSQSGTRTECHNPAQAFGLQACHPDSWPVGLDTLLEHASLDIPREGSRDFSAVSRRRREEIISFLASESLAGITSNPERIKINLRAAPNSSEGPARHILARLNTRFPKLHCDPNNAADMAFHLGNRAPSNGTVSEQTRRRVLLAILDDPSVSVSFNNTDANNPALFNRTAGRPALHFMARIDPSAPEQVIFGILHIDAQSYKPRGTTGHDRILAPGEGYDKHALAQHQGEVEPLYLQYQRSENSPHLTLRRAFLGDHLVAEPIRPGNYTGELAVAYGSGGRILRRADTTWLPGMQYRTGSQSAASTYFSTVGNSPLFPYVEVYPGQADTEGAHPTAHRYSPGTYTLIIEGENGDFLTTGRLLSRNGGTGVEADNTTGLPFVRGSRAPGDSVERTRTDVGFGAFLRRNQSYHDNRLMGRVARMHLVGSVLPPFWASTAPSPIFADGSYRVGAHYSPVNAAWIGPHYAEGYLYNPFSSTVGEPPQMGLDLYTRPGENPRLNLWADIVGVGLGLHSIDTGFYLGFNVFAGPQLYVGTQEEGPFGAGLQASLRAFAGWQRGAFELRAVSEARCEVGGGYAANDGFGHAGCAWYPLMFEIGARSRMHY